jgi:transcriptional regulator with XRE-family HTH domain
MTFGERLKLLREKQDLTLDEIASKLGVSYWALSKYKTEEWKSETTNF